MTAKQEISAHGPETYQVSGAVTGGQLVVPDGQQITVAAAGATDVLGVAVQDADLASNQNTSGTNVTAAIDRQEVAVAYRGVYRLTFDGAGSGAAFGALLVAGASGTVDAYTAGTSTYDAIVGKCVEPAGATAGNEARVRLLLG